MKESQKTKVLDWLKGGNTLEPAQAKELGMGMRLASIIEVLRNKEHYHIIDLNEGTKDNWSKYTLATGTHCKPSEAVKGPDTQSHTKQDTVENTDTPTPYKSKISRINKSLSESERKSLIERCRKILMGYPEGHREGENIKVQILELGGKV